MTTKRADVELRFTAKNLGKRTLAEIEAAILDIEKAQAKLVTSSDLAARSTASYQTEVSQLLKVLDTLGERKAALKAFQQQQIELAEAKTRAAAAREEFERLSASMTGLGSAGNGVKAALKGTKDELASTENAVKGAEAGLEKIRKTLEGFGAQTDDVGLLRFVEGVDAATIKANATLEKTQQNIKEIESAQSRVNQKTVEYAGLFDRIAVEQAGLVKGIQGISEAARFQAQIQREAAASQRANLVKGLQGLSEVAKFQSEIARDAAAASSQLEKEAQRLRELGSSALKTADNVTQIANSVDKLAAKGRGLEKILDPGAAALATLAGAEQAITELGQEIGKLEGVTNATSDSTKRLKAAYDQLDQAADQLNKQAGINESLRQQSARVEEAEQKFLRLRGELIQVAAALERADAPTDAMADSVKRLELAVERSATVLARERQELARYQAQAEAAGLSTTELVQDQLRLEAAARGVVAGQQRVTNALREQGVVFEQTSKKLKLFNSDGRTSLSIYQRIRGEVSSLITAYVGLFAAIQGVERVYKASVTQQQIQAKLLAVTNGDLRKAAEEYDFVRQVAARYGLVLSDAATEYASLAISAQGANLSVNETRFLFDRLSAALVGAGLSTERQSLAFRAVQQIFNKQKVALEELSSQLGDSLPGALSRFAQSSGVSVASFLELVKAGKVPAEQTLAFVDAYAKSVEAATKRISEGPAARIARLKTAIFDFQNAVAESGLLEALTALADKLTEFLKSDQGKEFARTLGAAFSFVADALIGLMDNIDLAADLVVALAQAFVTIKVAQLAGDISHLASVFVTMGAGASVAGRSLVFLTTTLSKLSGLAAALGAGYTLGTFMYEQSGYVRFYAAQIAGYVDLLVRNIGTSFEYLSEEPLDAFMEFLYAVDKALGQMLSSLSALLGFEAGEKFFDRRTQRHERRFKGTTLGARFAENRRIVEQTSQFADIENFNDPLGLFPRTGAPARPAPAPQLTDKEAERAAARTLALQLATDKVKDKEQEARDKKSAATAEAALNERARITEQLIELEVQAANKSTEAELATLAEKRKLVEETTDAEVLAARLAQDRKLALDEVIARASKIVNDFNEIARERELRASALDENAKTLRGEGSVDEAERLSQEADQARRSAAEVRALGQARAESYKTAANEVLDYKSKLDAVKQSEDSINKVLAEREARYKEITEAAARTGESDADTQAKLQVVFDQTQMRLKELIALAIEAAKNIGDEGLAASLRTLSAEIENNRVKTNAFGQSIKDAYQNAGTTAVDSLANALAQVATNSVTFKDGLDGFLEGLANTFANLTQEIAALIIKQTILNAISGSTQGGGQGNDFIRGLFGLAASGGSASGGDASVYAGVSSATDYFSYYHGGGTVGNSGIRRRTDPSVFLGAPRFHSGGLPGLRPGEVPMIGLEGEEVLTKNDPRNSLNGGRSLIGGPRGGVSVVINTPDPGSFKNSKTEVGALIGDAIRRGGRNR